MDTPSSSSIQASSRILFTLAGFVDDTEVTPSGSGTDNFWRYHRGRLRHARAMVRQPDPRDSRSMDTVVWAGRMFVNIASYVFGFIVFFAMSCLLLLGGVRLMSEPGRYPEK